MITVTDYAKKHNISYEAVRKQINRYQDELDGHVYKVNRIKTLDEFAENLLDERRRINPVTVYTTERKDELQRLADQNQVLMQKVMELQDQLIKGQDLLLEAGKAKLLLDVQNERITTLTETNNDLSKQLIIAQGMKDAADQQRNEMRDLCERKQSELDQAKEKILAGDLQIQNKDEKIEDLTAQIEALKNRSLWERILNK